MNRREFLVTTGALAGAVRLNADAAAPFHQSTARAGVFQITEPYSTEVSGMGMYNTSTRRKEITVTVHASFALD